MTELSDDLLVAYADGQLARDQSVAVKRVVDSDEVAAQRVEALKQVCEHMEHAFDAMLVDEPVEEENQPESPYPLTGAAAMKAAPLSEAPARPAPLFGWQVMAAAAAGLVLLGALSGYMIRGDAPEEPAPVAIVPPVDPVPAWQRDVALAHGLFGRETLEVGLESQGNLDLVSFQLAKAIGTSVVIPDLTEVGLTFKRAQLLRREGTPIAQIAYLPASGPPVALYAKPQTEPDGAPTPVQGDDIRALSWWSGGVTYLLVGSLAVPELEKIVDAARKQTTPN